MGACRVSPLAQAASGLAQRCLPAKVRRESFIFRRLAMDSRPTACVIHLMAPQLIQAAVDLETGGEWDAPGAAPDPALLTGTDRE